MSAKPRPDSLCKSLDPNHVGQVSSRSDVSRREASVGEE
jgi:hypothetical protein